MVVFISASQEYIDYEENDFITDKKVESTKFRDIVLNYCKSFGLTVVNDNDKEAFLENLELIRKGESGIVIMLNFSSSENNTESGTMAYIGNDADRLDNIFAKNLVDTTSKVLSLNNLGVITEEVTHRSKIGLVAEQGVIVSLNICFISNQDDMDIYNANQYTLAAEIAKIIKKYDSMI